MARENTVSMERVDPDLSQEEQSYVRHYLGYADAFIRAAEENAFAELAAIGLKQNPSPAPADQPTASLVDNPSSAKDNSPARAA